MAARHTHAAIRCAGADVEPAMDAAVAVDLWFGPGGCGRPFERGEPGDRSLQILLPAR